jgi:hypothetical protein
MSKFTASANDLDEIVRIRTRESIRWWLRYPLSSVAVAAVAWFVSPAVSLIALGAFGAWTLSAYWHAKEMKAAYLWRYAWLQEGVSVSVREDGVECTTAWGSSFVRWRDELKLRSLETCFVLEDEGEDVVVLPKKYLDTTELLILNNRSEAQRTTKGGETS